MIPPNVFLKNGHWHPYQYAATTEYIRRDIIPEEMRTEIDNIIAKERVNYVKNFDFKAPKK